MSNQYPGGIIIANPTPPSGPYENSTASGIWTLDQATNYIKQGIWPTAGNQQPDAQFNYVTMLLHGDGTNGAQNNTFLDSSSNALTITRNGNTTQGSFSPYGANWSTNFVRLGTGYGDGFTFPNSTALQMGTGDFTIEMWVNESGTVSYQTLYEKGYVSAGGILIQMATDLKPYVYANGSLLMTSSTAFVVGVWTHLAVVRSGSTMTMYMNGVSVASASNSTNFNDTSIGGFGARSADNTYPFNGYLSNLRVVKGTAVYTGAFTPPTSPLTAISGTSLLVMQSNRFIDNSGNNVTLTAQNTPSIQRFNPFGTSTAYSTATFGGSAYCDGSGDYLSFTEQTLSGDFTLEGWFYPTNPSGTKQQCLFGGTSTNTQLDIDEYNYGGIGYYNSGARFDLGRYSGAPFFYHFCWNHFAYVRSGSTVTLYINGVSQAGAGGSVTDSGSFKLSAVLGNVSYGLSFLGYANIRVSTTARYSSNFTPATSPWTSDASTLLLIQMTNGAIYDNAMMNDLETVGNAQISTSVKKYGTGSLAFDGSGDWLKTASVPSNGLGAGDFTVELWVYLNNTTGTQSFVTTANSTLDYSPVFYNYGGELRWYDNAVKNTGGTLSANTWTHIAACRSSGTLRFFINGAQTPTSYSVATDYGNSVPIIVGSNNYGESLNGYIDDLRITKGYARYTANFTPPTAALPNIGPN